MFYCLAATRMWKSKHGFLSDCIVFNTFFYCLFLLNQIAQIKLVACFVETSTFKYNTELIALTAGTLKKKTKKPKQCMHTSWRVVIGKPSARNIRASGRERLICWPFEPLRWTCC